MKIVIIVSCLLATATAITTEDLDRYIEAWKVPIEKCGKENGYTDLTPQAIYQQEVSGGVANSTCVHACLLRSLGVLTFSGIDALKVGEYAGSIFADRPELVTKLKQAAIDCQAEVAKDIQDECKMAFLYAECYLNSH